MAAGRTHVTGSIDRLTCLIFSALHEYFLLVLAARTLRIELILVSPTFAA